jgi:hypothetical protein
VTENQRIIARVPSPPGASIPLASAVALVVSVVALIVAVWSAASREQVIENLSRGAEVGRKQQQMMEQFRQQFNADEP